MKRKKGSILDLVFIGVTLLSFAMALLIMYKLSSSINTEFQATDLIDNNGKAAMNDITNMYPGVVDNMFLVLAVGLSIVALVLASLVRFHPVFIVFFLIILSIIITISAVFSNIYIEMANNPELTVEAEALTMTTHIMGLLPWIIGIVGFILAIIMYKNWRDVQ